MSLSSRDKAILDAHNRYRAEVGIKPLVWSDSLAASAQQWADRLAQTHTFEHSDSLGENIASCTTGSKAPAELVDQWGEEKANFIARRVFQDREVGCPCSKTGNWLHVGHYTQIVWRGTQQVGCGFAQDVTTGDDILVARYHPAGNVRGQPVY